MRGLASTALSAGSARLPSVCVELPRDSVVVVWRGLSPLIVDCGVISSMPVRSVERTASSEECRASCVKSSRLSLGESWLTSPCARLRSSGIELRRAPPLCSGAGRLTLLVEAIMAGGGRIVEVARAEALVWTDPIDVDGLIAVLRAARTCGGSSCPSLASTASRACSTPTERGRVARGPTPDRLQNTHWPWASPGFAVSQAGQGRDGGDRQQDASSWAPELPWSAGGLSLKHSCSSLCPSR